MNAPPWFRTNLRSADTVSHPVFWYMFDGASRSNRAHLDSSGDKVSLGMEGDYKCIQHDVAVTFALTFSS